MAKSASGTCMWVWPCEPGFWTQFLSSPCLCACVVRRLSEDEIWPRLKRCVNKESSLTQSKQKHRFTTAAVTFLSVCYQVYMSWKWKYKAASLRRTTSCTFYPSVSRCCYRPSLLFKSPSFVSHWDLVVKFTAAWCQQVPQDTAVRPEIAFLSWHHNLNTTVIIPGLSGDLVFDCGFDADHI